MAPTRTDSARVVRRRFDPDLTARYRAYGA
jgi:hypothetical protein